VINDLGATPPRQGNDVQLSIDVDVQKLAEDSLAQGLELDRHAYDKEKKKDFVAPAGSVVVLDPRDGSVLAMASYPTFNPGDFVNGIRTEVFKGLTDPASYYPLNNRAVQGEYAPGSTFKVTSTAAAVANGFPLHGLYNCPASVTIGGHKFINDGAPNLGPMTFSEALIQSCDTVYYNLGYQMYQSDNVKANSVRSAKAPTQKMQQMELAWGFGKDTGVDLPEESTGTIPTRQWLYNMWEDNAHKGQNWCKNGKANGSYVQQIEYDDCQSGWVWEPGQAAIAAIGQGYITSTPLQLTNAYVALANGGKLYSPRLGEALVSASGKVVQQITPPVIRKLPVSSNTLAYIRSALAGVVTQGTAAGAFGGFPLNQVSAGGKTGTSQRSVPEIDPQTGQAKTYTDRRGRTRTKMSEKLRVDSWFIGFAPLENPQIAWAVIVEEGGYGARTSAPIAGNLLLKAQSLGLVTTSQPQPTPSPRPRR